MHTRFARAHSRARSQIIPNTSTTTTMSDRLTQLQICLDQLVAQFNATVNYVNTQLDLALLDEDANSVVNIAATAPLPGKKESTEQPSQQGGNQESAAAEKPSFDAVVNELSTDIILKSRQILMIIDSLPGIGTLPETQLKMIGELVTQLDETERLRVEKIQEKDRLLRWCEDLIIQISDGRRI